MSEPRLNARPWTLLQVLDYALGIVENYEMDVRTGIADGRLPDGFCQGEVYVGAAKRLRALRAEALAQHDAEIVRDYGTAGPPQERAL